MDGSLNREYLLRVVFHSVDNPKIVSGANIDRVFEIKLLNEEVAEACIPLVKAVYATIGYVVDEVFVYSRTAGVWEQIKPEVKEEK